MTRITKEELLEKIFNDDYEHLKGKKLRMTRVRVPGKEVCLAHIINTSQTPVYQNLGLHIGVHEGEDHTGESIGLIRFTPWEAVVVAADVAMKSADVEIVRNPAQGKLTFQTGDVHFIFHDSSSPYAGQTGEYPYILLL